MRQTQKTPISVIVADDHAGIRRSMGTLIASAPDMCLHGEASSCHEVVAMVAAMPPTIVLLDIQMPDGDGIGAARTIRAICPKVAVIMLTSFSDDAQIYAALRAGASGYLIKDVSGEALLQAIRAVARGEPYLHPTITRRLMQLMPPPENPFTALTDREYEILRLIARGLSNTEIAKTLELSREIIARHVSDIFRKLHVTDRAHAIVLAIHYGVATFEATIDKPPG